MKTIRIAQKELKSIIKNLDKASTTFDGFGCWLWDMMSKEDKERYNDAEWLLTISMKRLREIGGYQKNRD